MTAPIPQRRWFHQTPDRFVIGLLAVECLLWLSEQFQWFPLNRHKGWMVLIAVAAVGVMMLVMLLWFVASPIFRWRFQFSIRSLLVLVVVVALPFSWLAVEMKKARRQREAVVAIEKSGGDVGYDKKPAPLQNAQPPELAWLRDLVGDDFFAEVVIVRFRQVTDEGLEQIAGLTQLQALWLDGTKVTDAGLRHIAGLARLQSLRLERTQVTDAGLAHIAGLARLEVLSLDVTKVTDAGLRHIAGLAQCQHLSLNNTKITDTGLEHIAGLAQLECLHLSGTQVTDTGLEHVAGLTQLQRLSLDGTEVTDAGMMKLRQELPQCEILR